MRKVSNPSQCVRCSELEMTIEVIKEQNEENLNKQVELRKEIADLKKKIAERDKKLDDMQKEKTAITFFSQKAPEPKQLIAPPSKELIKPLEPPKAEQPPKGKGKGSKDAPKEQPKEAPKRKADDFDLEESTVTTEKKGSRKRAKANSDDAKPKPEKKSPASKGKGKASPKPQANLDLNAVSGVKNTGTPVIPDKGTTGEKVTPFGRPQFEEDVTPPKSTVGKTGEQKDSEPFKIKAFETVFSSSSDENSGKRRALGVQMLPAQGANAETKPQQGQKRNNVKKGEMQDEKKQEKKQGKLSRNNTEIIEGFICSKCKEFHEVKPGGGSGKDQICDNCIRKQDKKLVTATPEAFYDDKGFTLE
eukprot:TRINITY_DN1459_c0_g3_i7.p1 TRINITY_DN1459_c0_g3~~TRINITY_DN1459_c0_g3_i7.p1  ORF type:complete len:361 (+),score=109.64 TRINITY_DN1459_c0_g3_i7:419-1501(+)